MTKFKIEDGIPLNGQGGARLPLPPCPWPLEQMEIGQSFLIPKDLEPDHRKITRTLRKYARVIRDKDGARMSFHARAQADGTVRVWRLPYRTTKKK